MNLAITLALITFVGWGTGDLFTVVATRKIGGSLTVFWVFFFSFLLSLLLIPFAPTNLNSITLPLLLLNLFLGVLVVSGNVLVAKAFHESSAPLVGIIVQAFPAVVLLLSALIFKDVITPMQVGLIAIIFAGVTLCSVDFKKLLGSEKIIDRGMLFALGAMICLSIYFTFSRIVISAYGWFLPNFISTACFPIVYLFIKAQKEKFEIPKSLTVLGATFMVGLLIRAGDFALNYGLTLPNASSIVAPIASASPILFVVMSALVFKDKVSRQQVVGIVTALVGIVLLTTLK